MADNKNKWPDNAPGKFFVDDSCIACDACVLSAPDNFEMNENDGHAFVKIQPRNSQEEESCKEAMDCCPVESIGWNKDSSIS